MLPRGYNPANYGGKIWWNENDEEMRNIWGTQADYDAHIANGGTWEEYETVARKRVAKKIANSEDGMKIANKLLKFKEELLCKQIGEATEAELAFLDGTKAFSISRLVTPAAVGVGIQLIKNKNTGIESLDELDITDIDVNELAEFLYSSESLDDELSYFNQGRKPEFISQMAHLDKVPAYFAGFVCGQVEYELVKEKGIGKK